MLASRTSRGGGSSCGEGIVCGYDISGGSSSASAGRGPGPSLGKSCRGAPAHSLGFEAAGIEWRACSVGGAGATLADEQPARPPANRAPFVRSALAAGLRGAPSGEVGRSRRHERTDLVSSERRLPVGATAIVCRRRTAAAPPP